MSYPLFTHRETSPDFGFIAVANNQVGIFAAGDSGIAVADGYFLMLDPLPPGTHTLNYGGGITGSLIDETDYVYVSPPPIPLNFQRLNNALVLTWTNSVFVLQAAPAVNGPYTNVPTSVPFTNGPATSPYTNTLSGPQKFFRLWAY